jgi:hypothetical protein
MILDSRMAVTKREREGKRETGSKRGRERCN